MEKQKPNCCGLREEWKMRKRRKHIKTTFQEISCEKTEKDRVVIYLSRPQWRSLSQGNPKPSFHSWFGKAWLCVYNSYPPSPPQILFLESLIHRNKQCSQAFFFFRNTISYINEHSNLIDSFDHQVHPNEPHTRKYELGHCVLLAKIIKSYPFFSGMLQHLVYFLLQYIHKVQ